MDNRRWVLAEHPAAEVSRATFRRETGPVPSDAPAPGAVLLRHELLLCAPTIRNWISGQRESYYPSIDIGAPVLAPTASRVIQSDDAAFPTGARVIGLGTWQDAEWVVPATRGLRIIPDDIPTIDAMGVLGLNALTAYVGLLHVGQPKAGETLLVSGAAGSVGSIAAQIGHILGCHVVALCGSPEKADWLRDACGIADVIDYRREDVSARLAALCPDGIDIFFDNVGGTILRQAIARMNRGGRVALCGQIASYDGPPNRAEPPLDMMRIVYGSMTMRGFLLSDYGEEVPAATEQLRQWARDELIAHREDVRDGFDALPDTFAALFDGSNQGTLIARIADEQGHPL
jgi:NADPH-dependent curcumin reductase CurA